MSPLQSGSTATVTVVLTPESSVTGGQFSFNGGTVTVSSANDPNPGNNTITVAGQASDFAIDISPKNVTLGAAGETASYTVTLTPQPLYTSAIALNCSAGVPNQASCNFTTSSVTIPSNSPVTSTLNLTTTSRPITANAAPLRGPIYATWLALPGIALMGFGAAGRSRWGKILGIIILCALCGLVALQPACSSKKNTTTVSGTPAGSYVITLSGTSGTVSHNTTFTLTVP
jgi:hypothetical protein